MKADRASVSALATSLIRAVHTRCDVPTILEDPYGDRLITDAERSFLLDRLLLSLSAEKREEIGAIRDRDRALDLVVRANPAYAAVVVRARYTEDRLSDALERGVRQYVLIGAGMDTFAIRRPDLTGRLQVFEIDHPATQALKRERLAQADIEPPSNLHFLAVDLENESVAEVLSRSAYAPDAPAFFALLGVTQFLTREANLASMQAIASDAAPGSEVVFDYLDLDAFSADRAAEAIQRIRVERSTSDEPWVSGFDSKLLRADLAAVGLELVEDLSPVEAQARYCADRTDGLRMTPHVHLARGRVA